MDVDFTFHIEFGLVAQALLTRAVVALEALFTNGDKLWAILDDLEAEVFAAPIAALQLDRVELPLL